MIPACLDSNPSQDSTNITKGSLVQLPAIGGMLYADNILRPSPTGASTAIANYVLPLGTSPGLNGNARGMRVVYGGFTANNVNAKTVFAQIITQTASVTVFSHALTVSVVDVWRSWFDIWFTPGSGALAHRFSGMSIHGVAPGGVAGTLIMGGAAGIVFDATGSVTLRTGVNQVAASDVTQDLLTCEIF